MKNTLMKKSILGVGITDATEEDILEYIVEKIEKTTEKWYVVTPNPEILMYANTHPDFKEILNNAKISLADGVGVLWAANVLKNPLKSKVTGIDLLEKLVNRVSKKPITVGFLGGKAGIAEKAAECLVRRYPGLKVSFAASEISDLEANSSEVLSSKYTVSSMGPKSRSILNTKYQIPNTDILFVAFGFPKQEKFMADNLEKLNVRMMMGVGGALDYISASVPRAPRVLRNAGLEWFFRLLVQPWRIKRQLALPKFILLLLKEKFLI